MYSLYLCHVYVLNVMNFCDVQRANYANSVEMDDLYNQVELVVQSDVLKDCPLPTSPSQCVLPHCYCSKSGKKIPGGLAVGQTPQMVVLTFDDAINQKTFDIYKSIFDGRFRNPNNCPIRATFFVSHEWNNYDQAQYLYWQGHELSVNSITHETLTDKPATRWRHEMTGMRVLLQDHSRVDARRVRGLRAPQLAVGGNNQFSMMKEQGFTYDNSMSVDPGKASAPYWPQTLDYKQPWKCAVEPCPTKSFPGLWELPINQFYGYHIPEINKDKRGAMVRAVMKGDENQEEVEKILMQNFERSYTTNRAPYIITLNADFLVVLNQNQSIRALESFINKVLQKKDVWFVTGAQVVDWIRSPVDVAKANTFKPWLCAQAAAQLRPCENPNICRYETSLPTGEHKFTTCGECPEAYPWLHNPTGHV